MCFFSTGALISTLYLGLIPTLYFIKPPVETIQSVSFAVIEKKKKTFLIKL